MAAELRALSFNLSFAPVLDVHSEAQNQVIGQRAFADTPQQTARYALEFARGLSAGGMLACGKHFPGHGATVADSHLELPRLDAALRILEQRELVPFQRFVADGGQLLMTAHVLYPALDPLQPATLSGGIINGLLRGKMAFQGAVITDDLEMAALARFTPAARAVTALAAGADLLLEGYPKAATPLSVAEEMAQGVLAALEDGVLTTDALGASASRIQTLFDFVDQLQAQAPCPEDPLSGLGCSSHQQLCQRISARISA